MDSSFYVIAGDPTPLARARASGGKLWDSQKKAKYDWGLQLKIQCSQPQFKGALHLEGTFYFPMPASKKKLWDSMRGTYHIFKPDTSNLIKWVEDCSTGILYRDDCIIASVYFKKVYDDIPRTEFRIIQLENNANQSE